MITLTRMFTRITPMTKYPKFYEADTFSTYVKKAKLHVRNSRIQDSLKISRLLSRVSSKGKIDAT